MEALELVSVGNALENSLVVCMYINSQDRRKMSAVCFIRYCCTLGITHIDKITRLQRLPKTNSSQRRQQHSQKSVESLVSEYVLLVQRAHEPLTVPACPSTKPPHAAHQTHPINRSPSADDTNNPTYIHVHVQGVTRPIIQYLLTTCTICCYLPGGQLNPQQTKK